MTTVMGLCLIMSGILLMLVPNIDVIHQGTLNLGQALRNAWPVLPVEDDFADELAALREVE